MIMDAQLLQIVASFLVNGLLASDTGILHVGGLSGSTEAGTVPSWLTIGTGGVLVGVSFLFTSFMTDHDIIRRINDRRLLLPRLPIANEIFVWAARVVGITVLVLVVATGVAGPQAPTANFAILIVWGGWWAGYTMSVYLLGNTWPVLNPWRSIATILPQGGRQPYPEWLGAWPAVAGLLGFVLIEVVSPLAKDALLLASLVIAYSAVTFAGAHRFGVDTWFTQVDPVARVFHIYGQVAPIQRTADGVEFTLPVTRLTEYRLPDRAGQSAFIVALLWATTFDGLVTTNTWATVIRALVSWGVPPLLVYVLGMAGGFGAFFGVYRLAVRKSRETGDSYVTTGFIERWFAPSLVPIAVGYHLAHYLSYLITLAPLLAAAVANPFTAPPDPVVVVLPGWFGIIQLGFVLLGHVFALWVAHSLAFELFPGVLKPIRSQYPFVVVMIVYTIISMWVVAQPFTQPPYT